MANRRIIQRAENQAGDGYAALQQDAAIVGPVHKTVLRLNGRDPLGMLGAVLSNDVPQRPNEGAYALLLNPKGRIQTDLRVLKDGESVLVVTEPEGADAAREILGRYAPFSRVEIVEEMSWEMLGLYGPRAGELLGLDLAEHESARTDLGGAGVLAAGVEVPAPGYDLFGPRTALDALSERLREAGAAPADASAYETLRIEAGIPRFGSDITTETFPAEAGLLERAVSFTKGCYPGQETVARMYYRGHPNRELHRFAVEGALPAASTPILQGGKEAGFLTSVAPLPAGGTTFALGYLRRSADPAGELRAGASALRVSPR